MSAKPGKSWAEKLADDKDLPKVITLTGPAVKRWGGTTMVIAAPREIDALMRTVLRGRVTTINQRTPLVGREEAWHRIRLPHHNRDFFVDRRAHR